MCFICSSCPITASVTRDAVRCYIIRDVSTSLHCEQNRIFYAGQKVATACAPVICTRSQRVSWTLLVPRILGRRSWQTCLPAAMLLKIDSEGGTCMDPANMGKAVYTIYCADFTTRCGSIQNVVCMAILIVFYINKGALFCSRFAFMDT